MPNEFDTKRLPGSKTTAFELAHHLLVQDGDGNILNPHPQYLLKKDYTGGGGGFDITVHMNDPLAHINFYVPKAMLTQTIVDTHEKVPTSKAVYDVIQRIDSDLANKSPIDHTHTPQEIGAAPENHSHPEYALVDHTHSEYILNSRFKTVMTSGEQDVPSMLLLVDLNTRFVNHNHDGVYSPVGHTHTLESLGAAAANHNHDGVYSKIDHDHDERYALIVHEHPYVPTADLLAAGIYPELQLVENTESQDEESGETVVTKDDLNEKTTILRAYVESDVLNVPVEDNGWFSADPVEVTPAVYDDALGSYTSAGNVMVHQKFQTASSGVTYIRTGKQILSPQEDGTNLLDWEFSEWIAQGGGREIFEIFFSMSGRTPEGAFPLWETNVLTNCRETYPQFWEMANSLANETPPKIRVVPVEEYNAEIAAYKETGAFVINQETGSITLPTIRRFVGGISDLNDIGITSKGSVGEHAHPYASPWTGGTGSDGGGGNNLGFYRNDLDSNDASGTLIQEGGGKSIYYTRQGVVAGKFHNVLRLPDSLIPSSRVGSDTPLNIPVGDSIYITNIPSNSGAQPYRNTFWKRTQVTTGVLTDDYEQIEVDVATESENAPSHVKTAIYMQVYNGKTANSTQNVSAELEELRKRIAVLEGSTSTAVTGSTFVRFGTTVGDVYLKDWEEADGTAATTALSGYWKNIASAANTSNWRDHAMLLRIGNLSQFDSMVDDNGKFKIQIQSKIGVRVRENSSVAQTKMGYKPGEFVMGFTAIANSSYNYQLDVIRYIPVAPAGTWDRAPAGLNTALAAEMGITSPTLLAETATGWNGGPFNYISTHGCKLADGSYSRYINYAEEINSEDNNRVYAEFLTEFEFVVDMLFTDNQLPGTESDMIVEFKRGSESNGDTWWYRVWNSGWVEQGGKKSAVGAITYPVALAVEPDFVNLQGVFNHKGYWALKFESVTATGFTVWTESGGHVATVSGYYWQVKGMKASS